MQDHFEYCLTVGWRLQTVLEPRGAAWQYVHAILTCWMAYASHVQGRFEACF